VTTLKMTLVWLKVKPIRSRSWLSKHQPCQVGSLFTFSSHYFYGKLLLMILDS